MTENKKPISVLGDSISTFDGFTPPGGVYYGPSFGDITGVHSAEDTWWMKVIRAMDGELLANNSWSGSTVAPVGGLPACSPSRIKKLAVDGRTPEHVLILSGLNDVTQYVTPEVFADGYELMLRRVREAYPDAKVTCGTLVTGYLSNTPFTRSLALFRERLLPYNEGIRTAAERTGCQVADLAKLEAAYAAMDGLHPNGEGMSQIAEAWLKSVGLG